MAFNSFSDLVSKLNAIEAGIIARPTEKVILKEDEIVSPDSKVTPPAPSEEIVEPIETIKDEPVLDAQQQTEEQTEDDKKLENIISSVSDENDVAKNLEIVKTLLSNGAKSLNLVQRNKALDLFSKMLPEIISTTEVKVDDKLETPVEIPQEKEQEEAVKDAQEIASEKNDIHEDEKITEDVNFEKSPAEYGVAVGHLAAIHERINEAMLQVKKLVAEDKVPEANKLAAAAIISVVMSLESIIESKKTKSKMISEKTEKVAKTTKSSKISKKAKISKKKEDKINK